MNELEVRDHVSTSDGVAIGNLWKKDMSNCTLQTYSAELHSICTVWPCVFAMRILASVTQIHAATFRDNIVKMSSSTDQAEVAKPFFETAVKRRYQCCNMHGRSNGHVSGRRLSTRSNASKT